MKPPISRPSRTHDDGDEVPLEIGARIAPEDLFEARVEFLVDRLRAELLHQHIEPDALEVVAVVEVRELVHPGGARRTAPDVGVELAKHGVGEEEVWPRK